VDFEVNIYGEPIDVLREIDLIGGDQSWFIPEEVPVAFVYNRRNYAVMMATPDDIVDFVVGFSLTEQVVTDLSDILSLDIKHTSQGVDCRLKISDEKLEKLELTQRRRNFVGSASCGLCGLENVDTLFEVLPKVSSEPINLDCHAMIRAMQALKSHQNINAKTRSVHAAAWVSLDGEIICAREDVGRHNALDKLLGSLAITKVDCAAGFVLMSSRCSYEIVEKAARRGVKAILSISGPTAFAMRKAESANMSLYARSIGKTGQIGTERLA
jgi:formate dehydrogenase accessory protein FdhD